MLLSALMMDRAGAFISWTLGRWPFSILLGSPHTRSSLILPHAPTPYSSHVTSAYPIVILFAPRCIFPSRVYYTYLRTCMISRTPCVFSSSLTFLRCPHATNGVSGLVRSYSLILPINDKTSMCMLCGVAGFDVGCLSRRNIRVRHRDRHDGCPRPSGNALGFRFGDNISSGMLALALLSSSDPRGSRP